MATIGTVGGIVIDYRLRPRGRQETLMAGRIRIKSTATIEAPDFELRTIKSALFMPYDSQPLARPGAPPTLYGSVTVSGSSMNSVRVRSFRGSIVPHTGTQHIGTTEGGTMQASFFIIGA